MQCALLEANCGSLINWQGEETESLVFKIQSKRQNLPKEKVYQQKAYPMGLERADQTLREQEKIIKIEKTETH